MKSLAWAVVAALLFATPTVRADPATEAPVVEDEALARYLDTTASRHRKDRTLGALVNAALAVAVIPPGVILATRSDAGQQVAGAALLFHGALDLMAATFALSPSSMESLRPHYANRRAQGETIAAATTDTEQEWQDSIAGERRGRVVWGTLDIVLGGAEAAAGGYLMLEDRSVLSLNRQEQTIWGLVLASAGLYALAGGICGLLGTSTLEDQWAQYRSLAPPRARPSAPPSVVVAPTVGGAMSAVSLRF
jgi:hypothetical protein